MEYVIHVKKVNNYYSFFIFEVTNCDLKLQFFKLKKLTKSYLQCEHKYVIITLQ